MFTETPIEQIPLRQGRVAPSGFTSFAEAVSAGFVAEAIETDRWDYQRRTMSEQFESIWQQVESELGAEVARERLLNGLFQRDDDLPGAATMQRAIRNNPQYQRAVLAIANELEIADVPATREEMGTRVLETVRAEWEQAQGEMQMGTRLPGLAQFIGAGGAAATDELSLLLMPLGGPATSLPRTALRGAALGALGEAAILPRMFQVSEELDIPAPRPMEQIAMGAVFGAGLDVGGTLLQRGASYALLRAQAIRAPRDVRPMEAAEAVQDAEDALIAGRPVPPLQLTPEMRAPEAPRAPATPEGVAGDLPPVEAYQQDAGLVPDADFAPRGNELADIDAEIARIQQETPGIDRRNPLIDYIRERGGIQSRRLNPTTGEMESTIIAGELRARGITPRNFPRLFNNRTGMADLDNLVASEVFDDGPSPLRTADDGMYLDRDDLLDALSREANGEPVYRTAAVRDAVEHIRMLEETSEVIRRDMDAAMEAMDAPPVGFEGPYFPTRRDEPDADPLDRAIRAERAVEAYAAETGSATTPRLQYLAAQYLADFGGPVENAVTRAILDDIEDEFYEASAALAARRPEDLPDGAAVAAAARSDGAPEAQAGRASGDAGGDGPRSERTPAGEQLVTPGIAPITDRQRLESAQNAPLRGGSAAPDMGLFDEGARRQQDMFDDPTTPEATQAMDEWEAEIRDEFIEPPVPDGYVRLYHGGDVGGTNTVTSYRPRAEAHQNGGTMKYIDMAKDDDRLDMVRVNDFKTTAEFTLSERDVSALGGWREIRDDVAVQTEDGLFSARAFLDELEADADHLAAINACTARGRGTA